MRTWMTACGMAMVLALAAGFDAAAAECQGSGVITRIDGTPADVSIKRGPAKVNRPRVLEVLCTGDLVEVSGRSHVTLYIDGAGRVALTPGNSYRVEARTGAPSVPGNAYRLIAEEVLPDMKRLPWDLRTKGVGDPVRFMAPSDGVQVISAHRDRLLVRLDSGDAPLRFELRRRSGGILSAMETPSAQAVFTGLHLEPGSYLLAAESAGGQTAELRFDVAESAPPPSTESLAIGDPDLAVVLHALEIARTDPSRWSLEAVQLVNSIPAEAVDRERVLALIDSYGR